MSVGRTGTVKTDTLGRVSAEDMATEANEIASRSLVFALIAAGIALLGLLVAWRAHRLNVRNQPMVEWVVLENRVENFTEPFRWPLGTQSSS